MKPYSVILLFSLYILTYLTGASASETCPINEDPTDCENLACLETCERPHARHLCDVGLCRPGCKCKEGYVRTKDDGPCILPTECSAHCNKNQEYKSCGSPCPDRCHIRDQGCTGCAPGCYCKKGYILDNIGKECIEEEECKKFE